MVKNIKSCRYNISIFCRLVLFVVSLPALAMVDANYYYDEPTSYDSGNQIIRRDISFSTSHLIYQTSNKLNNYQAGIALLDTRLDFDSPQLGKEELLKVKIPVSGVNIFNEKNILTWNLTPGLHGEKDEFSNAKIRLEGSAMAFYQKGSLKWAYGAGFGDQFGKLQAFPIVGAFWQASAKSELLAIFPMFKYEYTNERTDKYNFSILPAGAQWTWKPNDVGNKDPGNIILKGTLFSVGGDFKVNDKFRAYSKIGLIVDRRFEVTNQEDTSKHQGVNLRNSWMVQFGASF